MPRLIQTVFFSVSRAASSLFSARRAELLPYTSSRGVVRKGEMIRQTRIRVIGYLNYYAITDNAARCNYYLYCVRRILFKWLNRKSQRSSFTWKRFAWVRAGQSPELAVSILSKCWRKEGSWRIDIRHSALLEQEQKYGDASAYVTTNPRTDS